MKSKFKKLFVTMFFEIIIAFLVFSIISKLFLHNEGWLRTSILNTVCWLVSALITFTAMLFTRKNDVIKAFLPIFILSLLVIFISGVLLDMPNWKGFSINIIVPLCISFLYHRPIFYKF